MVRGTALDTDPVRQVLSCPAVRAAIDRCDENNCANEACVQRFLRHFEGDVQAASKSLADTLEWRRKTRPHEIVCRDCRRDPHSHALRVVGIDNFERPVIVTDFSQAMHRFDGETAMQHLTRSIEDAIAIQTARQNRGASLLKAEQSMWLADFHGYSVLWDSNPRIAVMAARLLAHYPERLGRVVVIDAPKIFVATWKAVKQVINTATAAKVCFVQMADGSLEAELDAWAGGPLKQWILAEFADNRRPEYQHGEKEYWKAPANTIGGQPVHDPRASPEFLTSPEFKLTLTSRLAGDDAAVCQVGEPDLLDDTETFSI